MKQLKKIIIWFLLSLFTHSIVVLVTGTGYVQPDSSLYLELGRSFAKLNPLEFYDMGYRIHPLYPLAITSWVIIGKEAVSYINAFLISLVVFPAYLISQYTKDRINQFLIMLFSILLPSLIIYPTLIMAENLFIPLFITGFVFLAKYWENRSIENLILFIIFSFLATLTKVLGATLFVSFIILSIIEIVNIKNRKSMKNELSFDEIITIIISVILIGIIISLRGVPLDLEDFNHLLSFIPYITLGSFGIIFILPNEKLRLPYIILFIVYILAALSSNHLRYLDPLIVLITLCGLTGQPWSQKINLIIILIAIMIVILLFDYIIPIRGWIMLHVSTAHIMFMREFIGDATRFGSLIFLLPLLSIMIRNYSYAFISLFIALFFMFAGYIPNLGGQFVMDECYTLLTYLEYHYPDYNYVFERINWRNDRCVPWIELNHKNIYHKNLTIFRGQNVCDKIKNIRGYKICIPHNTS